MEDLNHYYRYASVNRFLKIEELTKLVRGIKLYAKADTNPVTILRVCKYFLGQFGIKEYDLSSRLKISKGYVQISLHNPDIPGVVEADIKILIKLRGEYQ